MARTVRDVRLDSRTVRERLEARKKPYYRVIEAGKHIGYYKGLRTGSWLARTYDGKKYAEKKLGMADDTLDANDMDVLSFSQAQAAARKWFDELARAEHGTPAGPYSVSSACDDYLKDYQHRRGKDEYNTNLRLNRIKDALGKVEVRKLTATQIKTWHREMGEAGRLTRSQAKDEAGDRKRIAFDPKDTEAQRRRLATANRMLTVLKAVLNLAFKNQEELGISIPAKTAWQSATPTRAVDAPKVRHLTDAEAVRLLNACPADFRDIVAAALLTGCRYGELCRLRVQDFDGAAAAIRVEISKSGKGRSVSLTDEGVAHFARLAKGKERGALLLVQASGEGWDTSHQIRRTRDACVAASIKPAISFHILRHTYGSRLAMRGAPMGVIAQQLGHADTRMTERHYAHLAPSYVSDVVRSLLGSIGVPVPANNVVSIT
ncbi:site-specific integrase [Novosphingobium sp. G106]|uniref:tyrosine-type recombinase/integrase n=1 Tax=Novosphingobium sp. G106 TaxID=2849500 RepID=UPI001C2CDE89|nr:site-specific integrase [Novosphingobium sp. G106]MBV1687449.1 site-specific integrase [Novosphingobium sp. G106]